jgi:hypothetical protein
VSPLNPTRVHDFRAARTIQRHLADLAREPLPVKSCTLTRYAYRVAVSLQRRFLVRRPRRQRHRREMPPAAPWPAVSRTRVSALSPGLTDPTLAPNALAPEVEWAFWCGQYSADRGTWGLKNGSQASGVE